MSSRKIVLDIETQKEFKEVGGKQNIEALKISMVGVYDYETDKYRGFEEHEMDELASLLAKVSEIIGFNHVGFDLHVLKPYLNGTAIDNFKVTDIMLELQKMTGHRISLDRVAQATLGIQKSGSGLKALEYYRKGEIDKLRKYCLDDVKLTKEVYDYGLANKSLKFQGAWGTYEVPVNFA